MFKKILIFVSLGIVIIGFILTPFFIHVRLSCQNQSGACSQDIVAKLDSLNGKNLFSAKSSIKSFFKNTPLVEDYSLQYKLPDVLEVNIIEATPIFSLFDRGSGNYFLIDARGKVLYIDTKTTLPLVSGTFGGLKVGDTITQDDLTALNIINGIYEMYQVKAAVVSGDALIVELPPGINVIFPLTGKDYQVLLGATRLIYTRIQNENLSGKYSEIDLRYKNPLLR